MEAVSVARSFEAAGNGGYAAPAVKRRVLLVDDHELVRAGIRTVILPKENEADLDEAEIERERAIAAEKAAESGKPADIIAKMVEGSIAKYRKEHALVSQLFVIDGKTKISDVVAKAGKDAGAEIKLVDYVRFQLGEGIEKEASDFAAEVAAASGVPQKA